MKEPLVSIGIPCYNRPEGLRHTLECITNQTYKNLEIVISDNGSPNRDVQRVGYESAHMDSRVAYYRHPNNMGGMYNAMFALNNSHGKYFMFAADDDSWDPIYVETLVNEHRTNKSVLLVVSGVTFFDKLDNKMYPKPIPMWFNNSRFHAMFFLISSHHWAYAKSNMVYGIYKKDFLKTLKLYEGCSYEIGNDILTLMRVLSKGNIRHVPCPLMKKGFEKLEKNTLAHFHVLGPVRYILNKTGIKKYQQHDEIDKFTKSASEIISESGFAMTQEIVLRVFNQINRIRLMVLF
jgi:glycosyltransferase involved in cell wall biosynthesis